MRAPWRACAALVGGVLSACGNSPPPVPATQAGDEPERCPRSAITRFADRDFPSPRWQRPMRNYQLAGCDINGQVPGAPDNEPWWDTMDFWVYEAPGALDNPEPMLVFYLHGTSQTPIDAALGVGWNELAEREGIIVVYPHGLDGQNNNWTWGETTAFGRVGQLESVSQITTAVQALYGIGPERTFIAGTSSGAISATMVAALYVDQFSGVMSVIGGSYNLSDPDGTQAYMAMGNKAKVMPAFLIHATADHLFPQEASREADTQWAGTNDRADNGSADGSISQVAEVDGTHMNLQAQREPAADECLERRSNNPCPSYPLGYETYPYEIHRYRDDFGAGETIVEAWYLQFMAHNYPYGNPEGNFTDPAGPDVTTAGYRFFRDILARRAREP
jgi:poly(3-hydroxybutyrate) depolymerase